MKLSDLKATDLLLLDAPDGDADLMAIARQAILNGRSKGSNFVKIEHISGNYIVGRWGDWHGNFWVYEATTSIVHKGSLKDLKDWIILCGQCVKERQQNQEAALKLSLEEATALRKLLGSHCTVGLLATCGLAGLLTRLGTLDGLLNLTTLGTIEGVKVHTEGPYPILYHQRDSK
jgi:hypothetical protein